MTIKWAIDKSTNEKIYKLEETYKLYASASLKQVNANPLDVDNIICRGLIDNYKKEIDSTLLGEMRILHEVIEKLKVNWIDIPNIVESLQSIIDKFNSDRSEYTLEYDKTFESEINRYSDI